ncbi:MAG: LysR family transcriptional regulator [Burkholderiaceae bacterium]|jgi:DNA-binding transcriptional LysR family regulator|nr:LysR family transcriptional regulator [Burkholderiaceae bacterium]MEB2318022.1 LysR family transcriptional regulator [Pseudomonadota bacterium]
MRALSLDRLRTLVCIVDLGSFAAAARALHLAPPTVSLHVSQLEERLGTSLLTRDRGHVCPTRAGEMLVERARLLLHQADAMVDDVRLMVEGKRDRVRLSAATPVIANLLPGVLERIERDHPGIEVELSVCTSEESLARVGQGTIDIGIVALLQPGVPGIRVLPWRRDPVVALVPSDWDHPRRATPAWLASRPLILNDSRTRLFRLTAEWFAAAGCHPRARIEHNYNEAIKSLVASGYGATLLSYEATPALVDPRITILPLSPPLWRPLGLAHRAGAIGQPVRLVLDALVPATAVRTAGAARPARTYSRSRGDDRSVNRP